MNLTRTEQDIILAEQYISACARALPVIGRVRVKKMKTNLRQARANLRLDDPVLDELIESGAYKRPWSSEVGTMDKVIAKYGG